MTTSVNSCTDPDGGTTCNPYYTGSGACTAHTDGNGDTCVFTTSVPVHNVPAATSCAGNPCTAADDATTCCRPSAKWYVCCFCFSFMFTCIKIHLTFSPSFFFISSSMTTSDIVEVCKGTLCSIVFDQIFDVLTYWHVDVCSHFSFLPFLPFLLISVF